MTTQPRIRVLVVDDAVVVRRFVTEALGQEPDIEVVGVAANGLIALQKIPQCNPDAITLDVEMAGMDGLTTLKEIRKTYARLPVIMFSTLTERGATATLDALALGASDYVTKPANVGSVTAGIQRVRDDLAPKIRSLCGRATAALPTKVATPAAGVPPVTAFRRPAPVFRSGVDLVAIGVSTGGPNALADLLPKLPADLPVPIVIVQHMPPMFTRLLAERLNAQCKIRVEEAAAGMVLTAGTAYIAPGDYHMTIRRDGARHVLALNQDPPENSCRPAVDVLFRSVAEQFGGRVLAVVLTGMGQDGLRGVEAIHPLGGHVVVQDAATSVVWGMPGFVANAGLAHRVLPLSAIASEITNAVASGRVGAPHTLGATHQAVR